MATKGQGTQYYVDPSLGSDTGDGSKATPWGRASGSVIQYALDNITPNTDHGDTINVKAGAPDVLAAQLSMATYGVRAENRPVTIQGYTTDAGDGGMAEIDGDGTYGLFGTAEDWINLVNLEIHNGGATQLLALDNNCTINECIIHDCTNATGITMDVYCMVTNSHFYDMAAFDFGLATVSSCYIKEGPNVSADSSFFTQVSGKFLNNIVITRSNVQAACRLAGQDLVFKNNTVLNISGLGVGLLNSSHYNGVRVVDNIIDNFATGYNFVSMNGYSVVGNVYANCTTDEINIDVSGIQDYRENQYNVTGELFERTGSDTFENRAAYYSPLDTGNIWYGSFEALGYDKGAVQHQAVASPSGGSTESKIYVQQRP